MRALATILRAFRAAEAAGQIVDAVDVSEHLLPREAPQMPSEVTVYVMRDARGVWRAETVDCDEAGEGVTPWIALAGLLR